MDEIKFKEYQERFRTAASRHDGNLIELPNGGTIFTKGKRHRDHLSIMSGVHGDERSGPLALLRWLEETEPGKLINKYTTLWICPLVNDDGWDKKNRLHNGLDLNRSFTNELAPEFLKVIMESLNNTNNPLGNRFSTFFDLHEDDEVNVPFLFHCIENSIQDVHTIAKLLDAKVELWSTEDNKWDGSSETYVRSIKYSWAMTLEATPFWELNKRIDWYMKFLNYCSRTW